MLFAFVFSLVAGGMLLFVKVVPREVLNLARDQFFKQEQLVRPSVKQNLKPAIDSDYALVLLGPIALVIILAPILVAGGALFLAPRPNPRRTFGIAAFLLALFVLALGSTGIFFIFTFGGLGYGYYQARKADPPASRMRARPAASTDDATAEEDDDVDGDQDVEDLDDDALDDDAVDDEAAAPGRRRRRLGRG